MANGFELILEGERRDLLTDQQKQLLSEARTRGLIPQVTGAPIGRVEPTPQAVVPPWTRLAQGVPQGRSGPRLRASAIDQRPAPQAFVPPTDPFAHPTIGQPPGTLPWNRPYDRKHTALDMLLSQGVMLGYGDEARARMGAGLDWLTGREPSYAEHLAREQEGMEAYRADNPFKSLLAEIGGAAFLGPAAKLPKVVGLLRGAYPETAKLAPQLINRSLFFGTPNPRAIKASKALTTPGRLGRRVPGWVRPMGLGAAYGGVYGSGTSESGLAPRTRGLLTGAGLGGALTGALSPIVKGTSRVAQTIADLVAARRGRPGAIRTIGRAMMKDVTTPGKIRQRISELGPEATIADVGGPSLQDVAKMAASVPGPARNRAIQLLEVRAGTEASRIGRSIEKNISGEDFYASADEFAETLKTQASPLYKKAFKSNQSISAPIIDRILATPSGKIALRKAAKSMADDMALVARPDPVFTAAAREAGMRATGQGVASGLKLRTLHYVKLAYDDMIGAAIKNNQTTRVGILTRTKNKFVKAMDEADKTGAYKEARSIYKNDIEIVKALEEGRNFLKRDREQIKRYINGVPNDDPMKVIPGLSSAGKRAYMVGAARLLKDRIDLAPDSSSAARRIFNNEMVRGKLRAVTGDKPKTYTDLSRTLVAELKFTQTRQRMLGGSPVTPKNPELERMRTAAGSAGALISSDLPMLGGHALVRAGIVRRWVMGLIGGTPEHAQDLSRLLFSRNPAVRKEVYDEIARIYPRLERSEAIRKGMGIILHRGTAQQAGIAAGGIPPLEYRPAMPFIGFSNGENRSQR
jgi:hypothetical protein